MDIVFKTTFELAKFMGHTETDILLHLAQGGIELAAAHPDIKLQPPRVTE
jgi:hypothetical protein